jgi:hypothetical protein
VINKNAFLGDIRRTILRVGGINVGSCFLRTLTIFQDTHDILGNIHTDGATKGMVIERDPAPTVYLGNITIIVRFVTYLSTAAIAGNIFHDIWVSDVELVRFLHGYRSRMYFGRHEIHGSHI